MTSSEGAVSYFPPPSGLKPVGMTPLGANQTQSVKNLPLKKQGTVNFRTSRNGASMSNITSIDAANSSFSTKL